MKSSLISFRQTLAAGFLAAFGFALPLEACGQTALRESLERLDRDNDGEVEPEEITSLARPYLERILRARGMSIERDNDIDDIMEAARRYHAQQSESSGYFELPRGQSSVKPFGPDPEAPLIPEFGLPEVKYAYNQDDLESADRILRSRDRNRDGYIDVSEAEGERWRERNPFENDFDGDGRLSRLELAQRYARRRWLEQASDALRNLPRTRTQSSSRNRDDDRGDSRWWRSGNNYWLTSSLMERFDANRNGRLESHETKEMGMPVGQMDIDVDGEISRQELFEYLSEVQEEAGSLSEGIPGWFFEFDQDGDRQVSMAEFATEWTEEKMAEFVSFDRNGDGLLTTTEVAQSKALMGGSFSNRTAEVLPPGKTVISEIEINEDIVIADLNLQLSITHTNVGYLDAFLTGPDGQRIELFTEVGGRDNNFEETIFDDQSDIPIVKARPPFNGSFLPEAAVKREPSLSHWTEKNAKGVWQLVVRGTRSDRFGMLHYWSLLIRPEEQLPGSTPATMQPVTASDSDSESSADRS